MKTKSKKLEESIIFKNEPYKYYFFHDKFEEILSEVIKQVKNSIDKNKLSYSNFHYDMDIIAKELVFLLLENKKIKNFKLSYSEFKTCYTITNHILLEENNEPILYNKLYRFNY